jgi:hypothetical protein
MRPELPAGVMLAPPYHTLATLLEQQSERIHWAFAAAGMRDRAERERAVLAAAARALRHIECGTHLGEPVLGQPPGVWVSWIRLGRRAVELAANLDRPLLVLGGSYDFNVAPSEIAAWQGLLERAPRVPHRVRILPCVTHALNCITQSDPARLRPLDIGREVAPEVVNEIVGFLDRQLGPRGPRPPGRNGVGGVVRSSAGAG